MQVEAIFWVEVEKIRPNPYQPRRDFDLERLNDLAESIRQYGILQPLVVTRHEVAKEDGGISSEYELIAGERRLRASKIAGLTQVPVIINSSIESERAKLEIAIIENLQREDLSPVDRALAFKRLTDEFGFNHMQISRKIGKSRVYVANTVRILNLPQEIIDALSAGKINEGHTRPLLMLSKKPEEQTTLFKEIVYKQINVREAESFARKVAVERARRERPETSPEVLAMEKRLSETFGTRVKIEPRDYGGKIVIDFFSDEDLRGILDLVYMSKIRRDPTELLNAYAEKIEQREAKKIADAAQIAEATEIANILENGSDVNSDFSENKQPDPQVVTEIPDEQLAHEVVQEERPLVEAAVIEINDEPRDENLYSVKNFTI